MRKLAMLTTAFLGLVSADLSYAQSNQAGPQPGLPPGAAIGAPNAVQPSPTGQIATTPTGPIAAPQPYNPPPARVTRRRVIRHRIVRHRHHYYRHHVAPAATDAAPTTN